jgi:hypothetical protein
MEYEFKDFRVILSGDEQVAIATIHVKPWIPENPGYDLGQLTLREKVVEVVKFPQPEKRDVLQEMILGRHKSGLVAYVAGYPELTSQDVMKKYWEDKHRDFMERARRREHKQMQKELDRR